MRVLLTGATGYLGAAVLAALRHGDHDVVTLVRSEVSAEAMRDMGAVAAVTDLTDIDAVASLAADVDGVIHCASPTDGTNAALDGAVLDAILPALAGTDRPYLHTGGTWVHGSGEITEHSPLNPPPIVGWRPAVNARVWAAARNGVRSVVVAPANLYGAGRGIPALIAHGPLSDERPPALRFPGAEQRFANVFVDDIAAFYVLALEHAPAGSYFLVANPDAPPISKMAEAASRARGFDGRVVPEPEPDTRRRLGPLTDAILLDQQVDCTQARQLGWTPAGPSLLQELEHGSYTETYDNPETSS